jgi:two-component system, cell cycle sensor histidine kinase and response regulator CckA
VGGGKETILLVEDEEAIRDLVREILKRRGYEVLEARHGQEALSACERHDGRIHLLLTDVLMPQMSGRDLAKRVRIRRPGVKVLFVSGYPDDTVLPEGVGPGAAYLSKPFTPDALTSKVRELLDAPDVS